MRQHRKSLLDSGAHDRFETLALCDDIHEDQALLKNREPIIF